MALQVFLGSDDRTAATRHGGVTISRRVRTRSTAQVQMRDDLINWRPLLGLEIRILENGTVRFAGIIDKISDALTAGTEGRAVLIDYTLQCSDYHQYLDRHRVKGVYENQTLKSIVDDLAAQDLGGGPLLYEGITTDNVDATPVITPQVVFDHVTMTEALEVLRSELAAAGSTGYEWWVDFAKNLWFAIPTPMSVGFDVVASSMVVKAGSWGGVTRVDDAARYANSVRVRFDSALVAPTVELFPGDGSATVFNTASAIGETPVISRSNPTVGAARYTQGGAAPHDDGTSGGAYTGAATATYSVEIDAAGTPDTFKWNKDGGTYTAGVAITGSAQTLSDGVTITFAATTGHEAGDKWEISAGGQTASVGVLGVDTGKDWYWKFGSNAITQDAAGAVLQASETLQVSYRVPFCNYVWAKDSAEILLRGMIEGGTGLHEIVLEDRDSKDIAGAQAFADGELALRKVIAQEVSYATFDYVEPGMMQHVDLGAHGLDEDFLIESVESTLLSDQKFLYRVTAVNAASRPDWARQLAAAFGGMSSSSGSGGGAPSGDKATFLLGVGDVQPIGQDVCPPFLVRRAGRCTEVCAAGKIAGAGAFVVDIFKSSDDGANWDSIFGAVGTAWKTANAINGAVSAGATSCAIDGMNASGTILAGDVFTVGGANYTVGANTTADGSGAAAAVVFSPAAPGGGFADNDVVTWDVNSHYPALAASSTAQIRRADFRPGYDTVAINDRLRIDVLAGSSEDWEEVTVVLRWGWLT